MWAATTLNKWMLSKNQLFIPYKMWAATTYRSTSTSKKSCLYPTKCGQPQPIRCNLHIIRVLYHILVSGNTIKSFNVQLFSIIYFINFKIHILYDELFHTISSSPLKQLKEV